MRIWKFANDNPKVGTWYVEPGALEAMGGIWQMLSGVVGHLPRLRAWRDRRAIQRLRRELPGVKGGVAHDRR